MDFGDQFKSTIYKTATYCGGGQGGRESGRIRAGGGREAGEGGTGCGSHARAGGRKRMKDIKFFNGFLVCF